VIKKHVLVTTSRNPTKSVRTLCNDFSHIFPNVMRINRGKLSLEGIIGKALELNVEKVMIIDRWRKGVGKMEFFKVSTNGLIGFPPEVYVQSVKFRRDFEKQAFKRIRSVAIVNSKQNFEIEKFERALSEFFDAPILSLKEVESSKFDCIMQVEANHLNHIFISFRLVPKLVEVGPRIEISHLDWKT